MPVEMVSRAFRNNQCLLLAQLSGIDLVLRLTALDSSALTHEW